MKIPQWRLIAHAPPSKMVAVHWETKTHRYHFWIKQNHKGTWFIENERIYKNPIVWDSNGNTKRLDAKAKCWWDIVNIITFEINQNRGELVNKAFEEAAKAEAEAEARWEHDLIEAYRTSFLREAERLMEDSDSEPGSLTLAIDVLQSLHSKYNNMTIRAVAHAVHSAERPDRSKYR